MPRNPVLTLHNVKGQVAPKLPRLRAPKGGLVVAGRSYRAGVFLPESARPTLEALAQTPAQPTAPAVVVGILGFSYRVEALAIAPSIGDVAFALHDIDRNRRHHVHRATSGELVCDCGDYEFRKKGTGLPCKHGRRLQELGLIPTAVVALRRPEAAALTPPPARRRRFEPTPEECRLAALIFNA